MNVIVPEPSLSFTRTENEVLCSRPSAMRKRLRRRFHDLQMLRAFRANLHLGVFAGPFDVVRDGHADLEFVAGRGQDRHARRDDKRSANQRIALRRAGRIVRHRHRHDRQRAAEIIRHIIDHFARVVSASMIPDQNTTGFSVTRLNGFNCFCDVAVATEGGDRAQDRELRHDQIDDLRRLDAERAFAEEEPERIGQLVIAHLQNALIDREDRDLRWPIGLVADAQAARPVWRSRPFPARSSGAASRCSR